MQRKRRQKKTSKSAKNCLQNKGNSNYKKRLKWFAKKKKGNENNKKRAKNGLLRKKKKTELRKSANNGLQRKKKGNIKSQKWFLRKRRKI